VNWDAISAAAEVIGAGAVVITLVYLAIQTRDNVRIERARAVWDAQISFVEVNDMLADGGKISELVFESLSNPDGLSQKDRYLQSLVSENGGTARALYGWNPRA
jgi:hypothetical protein